MFVYRSCVAMYCCPHCCFAFTRLSICVVETRYNKDNIQNTRYVLINLPVKLSFSEIFLTLILETKKIKYSIFCKFSSLKRIVYVVCLSC